MTEADHLRDNPATKELRSRAGILEPESLLLASTKTEVALGAWLDTIAADATQRPAALTMRPKTASKQPLLEAFSELDSTSTAAPLAMKGTIAEGGMGLIRIAEQEALGRTVVVKTLRADFSADAAEHVLREAWATGGLEHPNIVPVHDIRVDENGAPLIVLKRIEGLSWTQLMGDEAAVKERFGHSASLLEWNLEILKQVIQAIRFAHSRGVLHRDLKPDNVMIGSFGEVYVVDWGIALSLPIVEESRLPAAEDEDSMAGTPCYMAPEMLGNAPLDERTDTYLLGAILYEILSGNPPHQSNTLRSLMEDIRRSEPAPPEGACPLLTALCLKAMSANPKDRFQTAGELAAALDECIEQRESQRLATLADTQRDKLKALLETPDPSRDECYRLFGALRLGYIEALRVWNQNIDAQEALDRARLDLIEFELRQGSPNAAHSIAAELSAPPEGLAKRIEEAQQKQRDEQEELGQFRENSNLLVGSRTRIFLILILGFIWTIAPVGATYWYFEALMQSYWGLSVITAAFALFASALWFWARESLTKTLVNRRLSAALFTIFPSQFFLFAGGYLMDMPVLIAHQLLLFLWLSLALSAVATVDKRFFPVVIGYAAGFLVASAWPDARFYAMSGGNLILTVTSVVIWYPDQDYYQSGRFSKLGGKRIPRDAA